MSSYLPQHEGLLPPWLLLVAVTAVGNAVQAYTTLSYTTRLYSGPLPSKGAPSKLAPTWSQPITTNSPATPLAGRLFGTWSFMAGVIRFYAAYDISNPVMYQLALWTYIIGFFHFGSELVAFKTARFWTPVLAPMAVAGASLVWMLTQWSYYVK